MRPGWKEACMRIRCWQACAIWRPLRITIAYRETPRGRGGYSLRDVTPCHKSLNIGIIAFAASHFQSRPWWEQCALYMLKLIINTLIQVSVLVRASRASHGHVMAHLLFLVPLTCNSWSCSVSSVFRAPCRSKSSVILLYGSFIYKKKMMFKLQTRNDLPHFHQDTKTTFNINLIHTILSIYNE